VQDDRALEAGERSERVVVRGARVDDNGFPQLGGETELGLEHIPLRLGRCVIAVPVEADLPHRHDLSMPLEAADLVDIARRGFMRMNADDGVDVVEPVGEVDRLRGTDGEDAAHARRARACDDLGRILAERVEMRVCVDHDGSMPSRASSSAAVSGGSLRKSGVGSRSVRPG